VRKIRLIKSMVAANSSGRTARGPSTLGTSHRPSTTAGAGTGHIRQHSADCPAAPPQPGGYLRPAHAAGRTRPHRRPSAPGLCGAGREQRLAVAALRGGASGDGGDAGRGAVVLAALVVVALPWPRCPAWRSARSGPCHRDVNRTRRKRGALCSHCGGVDRAHVSSVV
jgi:hypothetical protein